MPIVILLGILLLLALLLVIKYYCKNIERTDESESNSQEEINSCIEFGVDCDSNSKQKQLCSQTKECPRCKATVPHEAIKCKYCGSLVLDLAWFETTTGILLGLLVSTLLGIGLAIFFKGNDSSLLTMTTGVCLVVVWSIYLTGIYRGLKIGSFVMGVITAITLTPIIACLIISILKARNNNYNCLSSSRFYSHVVFIIIVLFPLLGLFFVIKSSTAVSHEGRRLQSIIDQEMKRLNNNPHINGKGLTCKELKFNIDEDDGHYQGYGVLSDGTRFTVSLKVDHENDSSYYITYPLWLRIDEIQKLIKEWINRDIVKKDSLSMYELSCTNVALYKDTEISLKGFAIFQDLQKVTVEVIQTEDDVQYECKLNELDPKRLKLKSSNTASAEIICTLEIYNRINKGMFYDEVVKIVGSKGELISSSKTDDIQTEIYIWENPDSSSIHIEFQNNAVSMKSHYGLKK